MQGQPPAQIQVQPPAQIQVQPPAERGPISERLVPGRARLTIGPAEIQTMRRLVQGGGLNFACNAVFCACRGDADCNDMFGTNVCGGRAICIDDYCYCGRP